DQFRHRLPGPRPSTDEMNRLVVDVDDADRLIEVVGPRLPALVLIEDLVLQVVSQRTEQRAEGERDTIGTDDHQDVGAPFLQLAQRPLRPDRHPIGNRLRKRTLRPGMPASKRITTLSQIVFELIDPAQLSDEKSRIGSPSPRPRTPSILKGSVGGRRILELLRPGAIPARYPRRTI